MAGKVPHKAVPHNEPTPERRSVSDVLAATRQVLANVQLGMRNIQAADPTQRIPGLHNVIVFGRAVTIALQRLRNIVNGFDEWWATQIPDKDPLLKYISDSRNAILKEAVLPTTSSSVYIEHFSGNPMQMVTGTPPAGATSVFVGDNVGGSGWIVRLPDGTEQKFYGELSPLFQGTVTAHLPAAPTEFLGEPLPDNTIEGVAKSYVAWLESVVAEAEHRFNP